MSAWSTAKLDDLVFNTPTIEKSMEYVMNIPPLLQSSVEHAPLELWVNDASALKQVPQEHQDMSPDMFLNNVDCPISSSY